MLLMIEGWGWVMVGSGKDGLGQGGDWSGFVFGRLSVIVY